MLTERILEAARRRDDTRAFRQASLDVIRDVVAFDVALFHELSPRAPLASAALVGIDASELASSMPSWDDNAVVLGRLRDRAISQGGIATDLEAFPPRSRGRRAWTERVAHPLGLRSAIVLHLIAYDRIISVVLLGRRRAPPFSTDDRRALEPLLPALAVGDALAQSHERRPHAGLPTALQCVDQRLTPRQREVVVHVALGHTNVEAARALGISANTVRNLLVQVCARLHASNRAEVVRLAVLR